MSTWTFTCEQHPHLRWTKNKCGVGFMGRGVLLFSGDLSTGKPASPFSQTEHSLAQLTQEFQDHHRSKYAVECDCPLSLLRVVAEEYQPFPPHVRYCEECGHETDDVNPADHCGKPMVLVAGVVVVEEGALS